ncbi:MAG TPA: LLM class flavin-dependent oxidoreductase [Actinomycetes bacterium]|jgi:alkanesulfonate monooxygenase SsuD/methylene tetrahydromethanopterin reductase-like flavin-dependent oxidoreductase (luciferase family)|nr:LLM class flavin-dependent oxidoreductase [Actinomycetes bacterium]
MDIGIGLPNVVRGTPGAVFRAWARRGEERGFAGLSTIDRIAYPSHDSLTALSVAAGATDRIRLVSGILLGPVYSPALLAKASATLHSMSGGRLTLGLSVGGRQDDFDTVGRPFHTRGRDFDAALELMHRAWSGEPVGASPKPVCPPLPDGVRVPVIIGGNTDAAVRRAVRWGEGWIAGGGGPDAAAPMIQLVRAAWKDSGRGGEPRIGALAYFALGEDAVGAGASNLLDYYAFAGPYAQRIAESVLASPRAVRDAVGAFEDVGVTELYFDPAASSLDQVDQLADIVL